MDHFFRIILLIAACVIPLYFIDIENKFIIQLCAIAGVLVAYVLGYFILKAIKKKNDRQSNKEV